MLKPVFGWTVFFIPMQKCTLIIALITCAPFSAVFKIFVVLASFLSQKRTEEMTVQQNNILDHLSSAEAALSQTNSVFGLLQKSKEVLK